MVIATRTPSMAATQERLYADFGGDSFNSTFVPGSSTACQIELSKAEVGTKVDAVKVKDRLAWPMKNARTMTSPFGPRADPLTGVPSFHTGIDLAEPCGAPILAAADGTVKFQGAAGDYGYRVVVEHEQVDGKPLLTTYSHLQAISVKAGQKVKQGDTLGDEGTTGWSTGCHLHFEVILDNWYTDGWTWLTGEPARAASVKVGSIMPVGAITTPQASPTPTPTPTPSATPSATPSDTPTATAAPVPSPTETTAAPAPTSGAPSPVVPVPTSAAPVVPDPTSAAPVAPQPTSVPPVTPTSAAPVVTPRPTPTLPACAPTTPGTTPTPNPTTAPTCA